MKISPIEKILLSLTAAFLLLAAGYLLGSGRGTAPYRVEALPPAAEETARAGAARSPEAGAMEPININTATAQELDALPGIGAKRAADIVADREANGPFRIPEDITRVPGIGEATLEGLIDYITVE